MIKTNQLPNNILERIPAAAAYLDSRPDVAFSLLFGSLAKGKQTPLSDVDIAVYLTHDDELAQAKMEILGCLNDILGTDEIDLVILNKATLPISMNILKNSKRLTDRQPHIRHRHLSITMRKYFDYHRNIESKILTRRYLGG
ncbi:type VII toxin-antitoxin system MntA family adenylyltransferase antitoxin [Desulfatitalea alkaliphila]|uniref:Nucleotidyltransferase domain-containing protein n=1 Tax=Desulfatitalea alkaliphila TaxID=2929485 RepID=A0AA41RBJ2_9BACT|nr:nucleotidyltransferase domain-containing protein [Desulfatitalea alkaliphila]MCJ8502118.1 nucleotidyltransferase domain-containing protein [Desulfatitalea alkaliphila]